jgi:phenylalanyl-tRNA synthetase beta chain
LVARWDLRIDRLVVAELSVAGLTAGQLPVVRIGPIARYPAVERDLAIVVPEAVPAAAVDATIRRSAGPLLVDVRLFDVYRGAPLAGGEKSLAERLVFQAPDRTLTDAEVDATLADVATALATELEARLRT